MEASSGLGWRLARVVSGKPGRQFGCDARTFSAGTLTPVELWRCSEASVLVMRNHEWLRRTPAVGALS